MVGYDMNGNKREASMLSAAAPAIRRGGWRSVPLGLFLVGIMCSSVVLAHTPQMDANLQDWCLGAPSNKGANRIEDSSVILECGNCSVATNRACEINSDCPAGQTCVNLTSKTETVWWDNRTDGAVNDLGTVAMTQDNTNLYITAELWVDPDPTSLPFGEVAIDYTPGGNAFWHDPFARLTNPGTCSGDPTRACTNPLDCHFCAISNEPFPSDRRRTCGSDNPSPPVNGSGMCSDEPGDNCVTNQTCVGVGTAGHIPGVGLNTAPASVPDHLLVFDFSRWLLGLEGGKSVLVMTANNGSWVAGQDFVPLVNPGASGGSGGPPGSVEVAIPWSAFGCTGCPAACVCPGFGPGQDFRFTMIIARGTTTLDYTPDGPFEDVMSESVAGNTTTSLNSCPGFGIVTTNCEIADRSTDAFIPPGEVVALAGGRTSDLLIDVSGAKGGGGLGLALQWGASCSVVDTDYEVYEGQIGDWYSHSPLSCSTGGATSANVTSGAGDHYYLIVPTNTATEGSYGEDSDGFERPDSVAACRQQMLGNCP